ncbi:MAG: RDD family protein [Actinomycetota bacterium]|nr:RDD family protein [Actinomycetota bacterium]
MKATGDPLEADPVTVGRGSAGQLERIAPWYKRLWAFFVDVGLATVPAAGFAWVAHGRHVMEDLSSSTLPSESTQSDFGAALAALEGLLYAALQILAIVGLAFYTLYLALLIYGLYAVILHAVSGQTIGKKVAEIRVLKLDGTSCDLPSALKRAAVFPGAALIPLVGLGTPIGLVMPLLTLGVVLVNGLSPLRDSKKRSLADKFGGTYVVDEERWP